jgi:hypothetical protein
MKRAKRRKGSVTYRRSVVVQYFLGITIGRLNLVASYITKMIANSSQILSFMLQITNTAKVRVSGIIYVKRNLVVLRQPHIKGKRICCIWPARDVSMLLACTRNRTSGRGAAVNLLLASLFQYKRICYRNCTSRV